MMPDWVSSVMTAAPVNRHATPVEDSLSTYLEEIGRYPLLSREEERALGAAIAAGDHDAIDALVCANLRFVVVIAKQYQHRGVSLPDLIAEGNFGLVRAAERFDQARGVKFISYAVWWIRQGILQALADYAHAVRVPAGQAGAVRRLGHHASQLSQTLGREPTTRELAEAVGMTEAEITAALPIARGALSFDAPLGDEREGRLLDVIADGESAAPDAATADADLASSVHQAMGVLRGREAEVHHEDFGLDGEDPRTLEEIGSRFHITRERVRQIKDKGLLRIRRSKQGRVLEAFR
jgi:RNA polymerase primary sigma factor